MSIFSSYQSKAPEFSADSLPVGDNRVIAISQKDLNSFLNWDGTVKLNLPSYTNSCPQKGFVMLSVDGKGMHAHRANGESYVHWDTLTHEQKASGKFTEVRGFACIINKKSKQLERVISEEGNVKCANIVDSICSALDATGMSLDEALDLAIAEKRVFVVTIAKETYDGKIQTVAKSFKKAKAVVAVPTSDIDA